MLHLLSPLQGTTEVQLEMNDGVTKVKNHATKHHVGTKHLPEELALG